MFRLQHSVTAMAILTTIGEMRSVQQPPLQNKDFISRVLQVSATCLEHQFLSDATYACEDCTTRCVHKMTSPNCINQCQGYFTKLRIEKLRNGTEATLQNLLSEIGKYQGDAENCKKTVEAYKVEMEKLQKEIENRANVAESEIRKYEEYVTELEKNATLEIQRIRSKMEKWQNAMENFKNETENIIRSQETRIKEQKKSNEGFKSNMIVVAVLTGVCSLSIVAVAIIITKGYISCGYRHRKISNRVEEPETEALQPDPAGEPDRRAFNPENDRRHEDSFN